MRFIETPLAGAFVIEPERISDHRGFFARLWCERELEAQGLKAVMVQTNVGFSRKAGTLRGLHFQQAPHEEVKVVRCPRGAAFDVIVDLRFDSPTYLEWFSVELDEENCRAIYVPEGFAQGYQTLRDDSEIYYHTSKSYHPESATGIRFDDPGLGIEWPLEISEISEQDASWPSLSSRRQLGMCGAPLGDQVGGSRT